MKRYALFVGILLASIGAQAGYPLQFFGRGVYGAWRDSVSAGMPVSATAIWGFDQSIPGGGVADWTGNGNSLTMVGTVPFGANGAGPFSDSNYFTSPAFALGTTFSVSVDASNVNWVSTTYQYIANGGTYSILGFEPSRGIFIRDENNTYFNSFITPSNTDKHSIVVSISAGSGGIYLDGVLIKAISGLTGFSIARVGKFPTAGRYFNGYLRSFRIYPTALTPAEIAALSANTVSKQYYTTANSGIVAQWELENSVADSYDANHLQMVGTVPLNVTGTGGINGIYAAGQFTAGNYLRGSSSIKDSMMGDFTVYMDVDLTPTLTATGYFLYMFDFSPTAGIGLRRTSASVASAEIYVGGVQTVINVPASTGRHRFAIVRAGSTILFYMDGLSVGSTPGGFTFTKLNAYYSIGANTGGGNPVQGYVNAARIYSRALSQAEITDLSNEAMDKNITNAHWRRRR